MSDTERKACIIQKSLIVMPHPLIHATPCPILHGISHTLTLTRPRPINTSNTPTCLHRVPSPIMHHATCTRYRNKSPTPCHPQSVDHVISTNPHHNTPTHQQCAKPTHLQQITTHPRPLGHTQQHISPTFAPSHIHCWHNLNNCTTPTHASRHT